MKSFFIWSQNPNHGKNTIAYNMANKIGTKKCNSALVTSYIPEDAESLDRKYTYQCFDYEQVNKFFRCFYLNRRKINRYKWEHDEILEKLKEDIKLIQKKFYYVFVESSDNSEEFNRIALSYVEGIVLVYNANDYASNQVLKDLAYIRKQQDSKPIKIVGVILNAYDSNKIEHINTVVELKKLFNTMVYTTPYNPNLNKSLGTHRIYIEKSPWSDFAIKIEEILNNIINNN